MSGVGCLETQSHRVKPQCPHPSHRRTSERPSVLFCGSRRAVKSFAVAALVLLHSVACCAFLVSSSQGPARLRSHPPSWTTGVRNNGRIRVEESWLRSKQGNDAEVGRTPDFGAASNSTLETRNGGGPIDALLSWLVSPEGAVSVGCFGLVALLAGQLVLGGDDGAVDARWAGFATRSNLLAVLACGAVAAHGIGKLDVEAAASEDVQLQGSSVPNPIGPWSTKAGWLLSAVLAATPASSAVLVVAAPISATDAPAWTVAAAAGVLPSDDLRQLPVPSAAPILDRYRSGIRPMDQETYLPALQALPGRLEFTSDSYLPSNTQAVLVVPVARPSAAVPHASIATVLVLGSNRARSFTPRDIAWAFALASRAAFTLPKERKTDARP